MAHNGEMSSYSAGGAAVHGEEVGFGSPSKEICSKNAIGFTANHYATNLSEKESDAFLAQPYQDRR